MWLLRGDATGLNGSDGAKRGAGEDSIPGRMSVGVVQLCMYGIVASAIVVRAALGAALDDLETLLRAVPSPRNKRTWNRPDRSAKIISRPIEQRFLPDARVSAFRLAGWSQQVSRGP